MDLGRIRRDVGKSSPKTSELLHSKEDFVSMLNRNFTRLMIMVVFSRVCSGVFWGWGSLWGRFW
jgi:hypothetical protein